MIPEKKNCKNCEKNIHGRADKKFCDDYCRNSYNNQLKSSSNNRVRNIQNYLIKNRYILEKILEDGLETVKIPRDKLFILGYQFKYHTHIYINPKGNTYFYCFEFGILELENGWLLVVRHRGD